MPEVSNMPLPKKLLAQGVRDMVRICDGRMSGTAYGTVVLHVAPEAASGGPLARCRPRRDHPRRTGRRLTLEVPEEELRAANPTPPPSPASPTPDAAGSGLHTDHVQQADTGADLDFLVGATGDLGSRESHRIASHQQRLADKARLLAEA